VTVEPRTIAVYGATRARAHCSGCRAAITWAVVVKSGKRMCFDGDPPPLRIERDDAGRLVQVLELDRNHWATCPKADTFRRHR
jgi:hypothetical protein